MTRLIYVDGHPWALYDLRIWTERLELRLQHGDVRLVELCAGAPAGCVPPHAEDAEGRTVALARFLDDFGAKAEQSRHAVEQAAGERTVRTKCRVAGTEALPDHPFVGAYRLALGEADRSHARAAGARFRGSWTWLR